MNVRGTHPSTAAHAAMRAGDARKPAGQSNVMLSISAPARMTADASRIGPEKCRTRLEDVMDPRLQMQAVTIPVGDASLVGTLALPQDAQSLVPFAHGSGSSRFSPRNQYVSGPLATGARWREPPSGLANGNGHFSRHTNRRGGGL
jgi:hypothetical protein